MANWWNWQPMLRRCIFPHCSAHSEGRLGRSVRLQKKCHRGRATGIWMQATCYRRRATIIYGFTRRVVNLAQRMSGFGRHRLRRNPLFYMIRGSAYVFIYTCRRRLGKRFPCTGIRWMVCHRAESSSMSRPMFFLQVRLFPSVNRLFTSYYTL